MAPTRRQLIASAGVLLGGGAVATLATDNAQAQTDTEINGLQVPDESVETDTPISTIALSVDASYQWESSVTPTRAILRLEATTTENYRQIDATTLPLEQSNSGSTTLEGSLSNLSGLDDLVPETKGAENTQDISIKITLELLHNGREIGRANAEETTTLKVSQSTVEVSASLGGSGNLEVTTETATE